MIRQLNCRVLPGFRDGDHDGVCAVLVRSTACAVNNLSRISRTGEDASELCAVYSLGLVLFPDFETSDTILDLDGLFNLVST